MKVRFSLLITLLILISISLIVQIDEFLPEKIIVVLKYFGNFHPVIVHFPIVLNVLIFLITFCGERKEKYFKIEIEEVLIYLTTYFTLLTIFIGWLNSFENDFSDSNLNTHRYLGLCLGIFSYTLCVFYKSLFSSKLISKLTVSILILLTTLTGYYGGILTHGEKHFSIEHIFQTEVDPEILIKNTPKDLQNEFTQNILPILNNNCIDCHGDEKRRGGLRLDGLKQIFSGGNSGSTINIKNGTSELLKRVSFEKNQSGFMPTKGDKLSKKEIKILHDWVLKLNSSLKLKEEAYHLAQLEDLNLKEVKIPNNNSFNNPIDKFINNYFLNNKLKWPKKADENILVRRLYLDILGIAPSIKDYKNGIKLLKNNNYNKLTELLLDDNLNYMQNWLSFWNDLLRNDYSGIGFIDKNRKQITNWLIDALYNNYPYTQMIKDIITEKNGADGFIKGIVWRGDLQAHQLPEMQAAQNVSSVFMGVDLRCASCHNSFTSDWRLKDVYNFANIFSEKSLAITRCGIKTSEKSSPTFLYPKIMSEINYASRGKRLSKLAEALTTKKNGRVPKSIVNRIWKRLMGRALIEPTYNLEGEGWNKELLNWLAKDFVANQYDIKHLIMQIVTSETYKLQRIKIKDSKKNKYVFYGPHQFRMTAEQYLDSLIAKCGKLPKSFNAELKDNKNIKYIYNSISKKDFIPRASLMHNSELMKVLGRPDRTRTLSARDDNLTPLQIIKLLGNEQLEEILSELAKIATLKSKKNEVIINYLFNIFYYRDALEEETITISNFMNKNLNLRDIIWTLSMHPNFMYIN